VCILKLEMASTKGMDSSNPDPFNIEKAFVSVFMAMKAMMEEMYEGRKKAKGIEQVSYFPGWD